jgi:arylsulfatase A-like enzyme
MIGKLNLCIGTASLILGITQTGIAGKRPNVLFLFADDQRADALGCAGNTHITTPNIDRLAQTGIRFSNSYVMGGHHGAISAPSRAMLLSGKSLFHVYDKLQGVETMPAHFGNHGYVTFGTGKWHNEKSAFESSFQKGKNVFLGGMSDHFKVPCREPGPDGKLGEPVFKGYSTDVFASAAIEFLDDYSKGNRQDPFFCYVAFTAPHDPRSPHPDYIGLYPDEAMPLPPNFNIAHPFAFDDMKVRDENLAPWPRTPEIIRASLADYYGLITHLDARIGDIIETLKKNKLFENTIIVYAADNGLAIGSHGLLGKQNLYEHSMKVPLILSGPGIPQGNVSDALVYLYDFFPTLTDLCDLPSPQGVDGKNLRPVIKGEHSSVRESLFLAYRNTIRAVRTEEWKLIWYPFLGHSQLFHLKNDPFELVNLADDEGNKEKKDELMAKLMEWQKTTGDTAALYPSKQLPMDFDYSKLKQVPDQWQPEYTLKKYFK